MTAIARTSLLTGRGHNGKHRECYAQIREMVAIVNGYDTNKIYHTRLNVAYDMGMAAPGAAPTTSGFGGGANVDGTVRWRVRWRDERTKTMSLASATLKVTATAASHVILRPGSPPARATHWILERTVDGGSVFFPVNRDSSNPDGTAIATTSYTDDVSDSTLRQRIAFSDNQGQLKPYRLVIANQGRFFFASAVKHTATATLTNGSAAVTSADGGFTSNMVGHDLSADGDTGTPYKVLSFTNANSITLAVNYGGSTGSKAVTISGPRDWAAHSESDSPEHGGGAEVGLLANEFRVGDDGEPITALVGMGPAGVLYAKASRMMFHSYTISPSLILGDGKLIPIAARRGCFNQNCIRFVDGRVYGMDYFGIWRMSPGGEPQEIGTSLAHEWKSNSLNLKMVENFRIDWCPFNRLLYFYICQGTDTYPRMAYVFDLMRNDWAGGRARLVSGTSAGCELPDSGGRLRHCFYTEAVNSASAYQWMDGIGKSGGAHPDCSPLNGTVTSGGSTTLTCSGASFPTAGEALNGVEVTKITSAGVEESKVIVSNTGTVLTVNSAWTTNPVAGDTFRIGPLVAKWRTGRLFAQVGHRKKEHYELWLWMKYKSSCTPLYVKAYYDNKAIADADRLAMSEDGVTQTLSSAAVKVDPTVFNHRYRVPLNQQPYTDVQLEFYSFEAGAPWEVMACDLMYEVEQRQGPTGK